MTIRLIKEDGGIEYTIFKGDKYIVSTSSYENALSLYNRFIEIEREAKKELDIKTIFKTEI